jgi:hypothetical protein
MLLVPPMAITPPSSGGGTPWYSVNGIAATVAYQAKGAASYSASKSNLANPGTYDAVEGDAPSWSSASGWTFNGSSNYLLIGNSFGYTAGGAIAIRYSSITTDGGIVCGTYNGVQCYMVPNNGGSLYIAINDASGGHYSGTQVSSGVVGFTGLDIYIDAVSQGTASGSTGSNTASSRYGIGSLGYSTGATEQYVAGSVQAFWLKSGSTISGTDMIALMQAMAAL